MGNLQWLAYFLATDSAFREAFAANPQEAITAREVVLTQIEMSTVLRFHSCLAASPQHLAAMLDSLDYPENWGGIDLGELFTSRST